ncbi:hypothetical protein PAAG_05890 [Paracoccidioides lutzii Pb01]|uniref:Uncharacterized protein n=1 Tax=Paracoccidioides lutzii (strain ATCC MYA-826 / Pb01) TaxID=502779 RepID=C1H549_PARBA|nr:hypothetical protein PAAG_05890 [Paracoccidioides lutzii Pb01]EEH34843.2 hypothetical protein PAAG_05890 [Paracoccidioides lutzii Pb01]
MDGVDNETSPVPKIVNGVVRMRERQMRTAITTGHRTYSSHRPGKIVKSSRECRPTVFTHTNSKKTQRNREFLHLLSDNPSLPQEGRNTAGSKVPFVPGWDESTSTAIKTSPPLPLSTVANQRAPLLNHGIGMHWLGVGTCKMPSDCPIERPPSEWNQLITDMMEPLLIKTAGDTANEEVFEPEKIINPRLFSQTASALPHLSPPKRTNRRSRRPPGEYKYPSRPALRAGREDHSSEFYMPTSSDRRKVMILSRSEHWKNMV